MTDNTASTDNTTTKGKAMTYSEIVATIPNDPAKFARAWYNATSGEKALTRGATPTNVIVAWTLAGMPTNYYSAPIAEDSIAAIITVRAINKDGSLGKRTVDVEVMHSEISAVREGKRGRWSVEDAVEAGKEKIGNRAPVRIATRTKTGEGDTFHIEPEKGEDGTEFITPERASDWIRTSAKDLEIEKLRAELEALRNK